ncbi:hypothetical protein SLEP1_g28353 [Rubroshorea leprosula]|uniref:Uncharacterized protein n=1 Tax=Rubroshorea leprosula TaxID=152421 RepID=A0AAV5JTJ9_9ROSI|nr:hypothetical protein SLEP1_g28353 [Rubroshorea leprosula]
MPSRNVEILTGNAFPFWQLQNRTNNVSVFRFSTPSFFLFHLLIALLESFYLNLMAEVYRCSIEIMLNDLRCF